MNVVKKVANSVRRPSLAIFSSSGPSLLADPEWEPFQYEIQQQALHYLMPGAQSTPEEKIQAVAKIGHMCWTGGKPASEFAAKNYFTLLANLLRSKEPLHAPLGLAPLSRPMNSIILVNDRIFSLQQVVKSLSEICCASTLTQDIARVQSFPELVVEFMTEGDDECVRWSLHALFYLLCNNESNQREALENPGFEAGVVRGLELDWDGWEHNEARELIHLCQLNHLLN